MVILLDRRGLETSLPDTPHRVVSAPVPVHMRRQQPVHPATEITVLVRVENDVKVIWHQTPSENPHRYSRGGTPHQILKIAVV
jgi:hypothetical protein